MYFLRCTTITIIMKAIITSAVKLLLVNIIFQTISFSQETFNKESISANNQQGQEIILQKSDLEQNGINSTLLNIDISNSDIVKLRNFDFSKYRNYYNLQEVQIENGPKIIIYSIEKMISIGQIFDQQFLDSKKNVDETNITHSIIPVINIGFGKTVATELH
jgi:hypothetical protein